MFYKCLAIHVNDVEIINHRCLHNTQQIILASILDQIIVKVNFRKYPVTFEIQELEQSKPTASEKFYMKYCKQGYQNIQATFYFGRIGKVPLVNKVDSPGCFVLVMYGPWNRECPPK